VIKPDRVWVEIDLDDIDNNIKEIKKRVDKVKLAPVIKADAYGHGACEVAQVLCENQVYMLVVATLKEAINLRKKGITSAILVLGYIRPENIEEAIDNNLAITLTNLEMAKEYSTIAKALNKVLYVHLKVDTGMNRVGFLYSNFEDINEALLLENLHFSGIFSHFSTADHQDFSYTNLQYKRFLEVLEKLEKKDINVALKHICNSGGIILHPDKYLDMVRPGLIIYGLYPSKASKDKSKMNLRPAMSFKSRIIQIKKVKKGEPISYNNQYIVKKDSLIATVACGYADGYSRVLSEKGRVYIKGKTYPITGTICMDMFMVDITDSLDIKEQDEVELFGKHIPVEELANLSGTINYEYVCKIGVRVPHVYIKNQQMVKINDFLE